MDSQPFVFISDREKGLATALQTVFPNATTAYCCQHIADNIQQRYRVKCRPLFWRCAQAKTEQLFKKALKALKEKNDAVIAYVNSISYKSWTQYAFLYSRFGYNISNIIESLNSVQNLLRSFSPLKIVNAIWSITIKTIYDRHYRPQQST